MTNIYSNPDDWYATYEDLNFASDEGLAVFKETFEKAEGLADEEFRETVIHCFFDLSGFLEKENRWDDIIMLRNIIIQHQFAFFKKEIAYIEPDLTRYFLHHNDTEQATESLKFISDFVFSDVDMLLGIHGLAIAYGKSDWLIRFADDNYAAFYEKRSEYMSDIYFAIDFCAFFAAAEKQYVLSKTTGVFDSTILVERGQRIGLLIKDHAAKINDLMQDDTIYGEGFKALYAHEDMQKLALHLAFCKYMYDEKGVSFTAADLIMDILTDFWEKEHCDFTTFDIAAFKDYANHLGGFMNNYEYKPILAPLGAIYKADFLKICGLLTEKQHDAVVAPCIILVDYFAHQYHWRLKDNGYLRTWQKPDSMPQSDFDTLLATIAKAYEPETEDTNRGAEEDRLRIAANMESWHFPKTASTTPQKAPAPRTYTPLIPPIKSAPKVGRNDNCPCGSGKKYKKCCGK